ncbi:MULTISPECIES: PqiB family protein [Vogesella]|uniref:MlaD family protein n=1 Tax=Vogesella indigofera TaxID=45465 RepID=A0ABT5I422_VOGIN|nr:MULTISPECIES: MlaD family protein [Vogesella]MCQ4145264.1 MlaD family protein [Vogesella sp. AC12]MDC7690932.1 MlaD family protein [Vogesella indigofera]
MMIDKRDDAPDEPVQQELPQARLEERRRWSPSLVWLIPVVAALIGGYLTVQAILSRGPTITIAFHNAEGLEAGKTRIKYRDVDIGEVTSVKVSEDRKSIIATAQISKEAEPYLTSDSRFWIVRPRIAGGSVSGLGTLLSGAYIGMDAGRSKTSSQRFTGLDVPPIITGDLPGRQFVLKSADLGSLDIGAPVYFRRVPVGQVVAYALDKSGQGLDLTVFINAPYDRFVVPDTRFWHASGVDLSISANGLKVNTQSLTAIALGGIAFESPSSGENAQPAAAGAVFGLAETRDVAMRTADHEVYPIRLKFQQSVRGLSVGAPVDFRGIVIGEVTAIGLEQDKARKDFNMLVDVRIFPSRLLAMSSNLDKDRSLRQQLSLKQMVTNGLRAQLRSGSLITGQLFVALDFFRDAKPAQLGHEQDMDVMPTIPGDLEELQAMMQRIARKLDKMPLESISAGLDQSVHELRAMLATTRQLMGNIDDKMLPQATQTLDKLQKTLDDTQQVLQANSPLQQDMRNAALEVSETARSVRALVDYLDRHPEALIRGKQGDAQ